MTVCLRWARKLRHIAIEQMPDKLVEERCATLIGLMIFCPEDDITGEKISQTYTEGGNIAISS